MFKPINTFYAHFVQFLREASSSRSDSSVDDTQAVLLQHFPFYRAPASVQNGNIRVAPRIHAAKAQGTKY